MPWTIQNQHRWSRISTNWWGYKSSCARQLIEYQVAETSKQEEEEIEPERDINRIAARSSSPNCCFFIIFQFQLSKPIKPSSFFTGTP
ncbi:hypothetical protein LINGRAHAP2_LOCUS15967, partial [Linum grandiflorum]